MTESLYAFDFSDFFPFLGPLSFGAIAGFAVGLAIKKTSKVMLIFFGIFFILVQVAAYYGYVSINWFRVQEAINPSLTTESLNQGLRNLIAILTFNVPFAATFIPMLILGLKKG